MEDKIIFNIDVMLAKHKMSVADCEKALELPVADYEDALIASCAKRGKM